MLWPGPGGLPDEPPKDSRCDKDCQRCETQYCDGRGLDCADPDNCRDCRAYDCPERINSNENQEEIKL